MSHYTVLVIGPDHEAQLAPYDENLPSEPRREDVDLDELIRMVQHFQASLPGPKTKLGRQIRVAHGDTLPLVADGTRITTPEHALVAALYREWSGRDLYRDTDGGYYAYTRYNEAAKWDWYAVGGRWAGYFTLKDGSEADTCCKGDVDLDRMRDEAGASAGERWDQVRAATGGGLFEPWETILTRLAGPTPSLDDLTGAESAEAMTAFRARVGTAREAYNAQAGASVLMACLGPFGDDRLVGMTREAWVQEARDGALTPFAVVKEGVWHESGRMGWFGHASDKQTPADWNRRFADLFDVPDDTELTLVDCHI